LLVLLATACTKAAPMDAGQTTNGLSCLAKSTVGFQPSTWVPPRPAHAGSCTDDEIDSYWSACAQLSALPIQCQQFVANHLGCAACLSPDTPDAGGPGPFLARAGAVDLNVGGCIAVVLGDNRPDGCGAKEQAARECAAFACQSCDGGSECTNAAGQGVCGDFQMRTCAELAGAAVCTLGDYKRVAEAFCR
jgi:hypothetical protein